MTGCWRSGFTAPSGTVIYRGSARPLCSPYLTRRFCRLRSSICLDVRRLASPDHGRARANVTRICPEPLFASNAVGRAFATLGALSHVVSVSPSKA